MQVCLCVCVCVHAFRLVVIFGRMRMKYRDICCVIRYHLLPLSPIRNFLSQLKECRSGKSMKGGGQGFFPECVIVMAVMIEDV